MRHHSDKGTFQVRSLICSEMSLVYFRMSAYYAPPWFCILLVPLDFHTTVRNFSQRGVLFASEWVRVTSFWANSLETKCPFFHLPKLVFEFTSAAQINKQTFLQIWRSFIITWRRYFPRTSVLSSQYLQFCTIGLTANSNFNRTVSLLRFRFVRSRPAMEIAN